MTGFHARRCRIPSKSASFSRVGFFRSSPLLRFWGNRWLRRSHEIIPLDSRLSFRHPAQPLFLRLLVEIEISLDSSTCHSSIPVSATLDRRTLSRNGISYLGAYKGPVLEVCLLSLPLDPRPLPPQTPSRCAQLTTRPSGISSLRFASPSRTSSMRPRFRSRSPRFLPRSRSPLGCRRHPKPRRLRLPRLWALNSYGLPHSSSPIRLLPHPVLPRRRKLRPRARVPKF